MEANSANAAVYARYSSEAQRETSIEDQVRLCCAKATTLGLVIVGTHSDSAISGTTPVAARPGGRAILEGAIAGRFSVLIVEGLDRLSRDVIEQETIIRRLEHRGIRIIGVLDGYDTHQGEMRKLVRGIRGLINETFLDDLRHKTHRGMAGQVARGFHVGPVSYGYGSVAAGPDATGKASGYRLVIVPEEAEILGRIFRDFGAGISCPRIVHKLNEERVPGPSGGTWGVSALYGNPQKGGGILNNQLYIGRMIWNRSRWVKNPDTHKRQRVARPEEEWIIERRPELRILADEEWALVRKRLNDPRSLARGRRRAPVRHSLLGGLLRCGKCSGPIVALDRYTYGCANRKNRGRAVCFGTNVSRRVLERAALAFVRETLLSSENLTRIETETQGLVADAQARVEAELKLRARRAAAIARQVDRIVDQIVAGDLSPAIQKSLKEAELSLEECRKQPPTMRSDPRIVSETVRSVLSNLDSALQGDLSVARIALRDLLADANFAVEG